MTDTRKDFEEWARLFMDKNERAPFSNEIWQACQSLNDKRIQQLLAVIAKKDEAITHALREHGGFTIKGETERICRDALAIKPENVELVEVGVVTYQTAQWSGRVSTEALQNQLVKVSDKLYTIKHK